MKCLANSSMYLASILSIRTLANIFNPPVTVCQFEPYIFEDNIFSLYES